MPTGAVTSDAVILLPGIMGSELVDARDKVVWGMSMGLLARHVFFRDVFERLEPGADDGIRASRPIQLTASIPFLSGVEPYSRLEYRLRDVTLDPAAVIPFAYDWRHSIVAAAEALAPVARAHLAQWRQQFAALPNEMRRGLPQPQLTLVGHSMGGLVAAWFATRLTDQGGADVRRIVTLGTPFGGSLNAVRVLSSGEQLPFGLFARALCKSARTMPGIYELVARYECVQGGRVITPSDLAGIGAPEELAGRAFATIDALTEALANADGDLVRSLVGTTQPTLQSVTFDDGVPNFAEEVTDRTGYQADHRGDGTVFRYAAALPDATPAYLPQSHGVLAKCNEGIEFTAAVVTERPLGAFQAASELGIRAPDMATVGQPFAVEAIDAEAGVMCQVANADTNELVAVQSMIAIDGTATATLTLPAIGLYRVSAAASGFSPVDCLVLAVEPERS